MQELCDEYYDVIMTSSKYWNYFSINYNQGFPAETMHRWNLTISGMRL